MEKNIGIDDLTESEYEACSLTDKKIYDKIVEWKKYVSQRNAHLVWDLSFLRDDLSDLVDNFIHIQNLFFSEIDKKI